MYPYKNIYLVFLLIFLISACATPSESEPTINKIIVPSYITYEAVMDKVEGGPPTDKYTRYYSVQKNIIGNTAEVGLIGVLVNTSDLDFASKNYSDSGQKCRFNEPDTYRLKEGQIVVRFNPTTYDENFITFCQDQVPDSINAIFVNLVSYEGDMEINHFGGQVNILVKLDD